MNTKQKMTFNMKMFENRMSYKMRRYHSNADYRNMSPDISDEEQEEEEVEVEDLEIPQILLMKREIYQYITPEEMYYSKFVPLSRRPRLNYSLKVVKEREKAIKMDAEGPPPEPLPKPKRYDEAETDEAIDAYYSLAPWMRFKDKK
ncbi:unnamed protein product [Diamesa serratosioi]